MKSEEQLLMELLDCVLDGSASDAERRQFARLVERHREWTAEFVQQLRMHSLLQWKSDQLNLPVPQKLETARNLRHSSTKSASATGGRLLWAVAATLLLACGIGGWLSTYGLYDGRNSIAEVVANPKTVWSDDSSALVGHKLVYPGHLELVSGTASLKFHSGARIALDGPASVQVETDHLLQLDRGKLAADIPHSIKGFTIATSAASVVDRGTRFDVVARDDGGTDVVTYEGAVDVEPTNHVGAIQTCVRQSEAARVDSHGSIVRLVEFQQASQGDQWRDVHPLPALTIRAVWDNLWSTKEDSHYLINARGLADDSRAYVDHPHEWNGLTAEGLPKFLQYADYVRMFNDYRYLPELEVDVDLARPAWLYIIYDDRAPAPAWLSEQFENIGIQVGLDEGPWENETPTHTLGVGPGKSIDNVFTVWRRRCDKAGLVKLGAMPKGSEARAMYGIAATPLD